MGEFIVHLPNEHTQGAESGQSLITRAKCKARGAAGCCAAYVFCTNGVPGSNEHVYAETEAARAAIATMANARMAIEWLEKC